MQYIHFAAKDGSTMEDGVVLIQCHIWTCAWGRSYCCWKKYRGWIRSYSLVALAGQYSTGFCWQ